MINRPLTSEECVHHIDFNKSNNDPKNLIIFSTDNDHQKYHGGGTLIPNGDGTYKCELKTKICLICGNTFHPIHDQMYCSSKCYHKSRLQSNITKEKLEELLSENSFEAVARMFDVSSNAVRKWCTSYGLPNKAAYYKTKKTKKESTIRRLTEGEEKEVIELYNNGESQLKLAERYNVSRWQIRNAIKKECE